MGTQELKRGNDAAPHHHGAGGSAAAAAAAEAKTHGQLAKRAAGLRVYFYELPSHLALACRVRSRRPYPAAPTAITRATGRH